MASFDPKKASRFQILRKNRAPVRFAHWFNRVVPRMKELNPELEKIAQNADFRLKDAEISSLQTGNGMPDRDGLVKYILPAAERLIESAQRQGDAAERLRPAGIDQWLMYAGYSPEHYRFIASADSPLYRARLEGGRWHVEPTSDEDESDFQFLCRTPGCLIILICSEEREEIYLIEPAESAEQISDGETLLLRTAGGNTFLADVEKGRYIEHRSDIVTTEGPADVEVKGRLLARAQVSKRSNHKGRKNPFRRDRLTIAVAPFQDALLPYVGKELGLFADEGLDVEFEEKPWYKFDPPKGSVEWLAFGNIYTFAKHLAGSRANDTAFLFGANIFNKGNAVLCSPDEWTDRFLGNLDQSLRGADRWRKILGSLRKGELEIYLPADSDFAVQLYETCRSFGIGFHIGDEEILGGETFVHIIETRNLAEDFVAQSDPLGDFHIGTLPQRLNLIQPKQGDEPWKLMLLPEDFTAQPQINGFIGSPTLIASDVLLRFLHVWFKIARLVNEEAGSVDQEHEAPKSRREADRFLKPSWIVDRAFKEGDPTVRLRYESVQTGKVIRQIAQAWSLEYFPVDPADVRQTIVGKGNRAPWRADLDQTLRYLIARGLPYDEVKQRCTKPDVLRALFPLEAVLQKYEAEYGDGKR